MTENVLDTYIVEKKETEDENLWILEIFGAYPGANFTQKRLERQLTVARSSGYKFILNRTIEPNMMWEHETDPSKVKFLFDVIHESCDNTGFDPANFKLLSGNALVNQCYDSWCALHDIQNKIKVVFCDFWITTLLGNDHEGSDINCNDHRQNILRPYYFTCLNRRFRKQKGDTLAWLHHNNIMEKHGHQIKVSFVFDDLDLEDTDNEFVNMYGDVLKTYPGSLEDPDMTRTGSHEFSNRSYPDLMTAEFEKAVMDSYYDIAIDFVQCEDFTDDEYATLKKEFPWWREMYVSEKTYKSMSAKKPFLIFGEKGILEFMRKRYGFLTYEEVLFDETYDIFDDYDERLDRVLDEAWKLLEKFDIEYMHESVYSGGVQDVINHNYRRVTELSKKYYILLERNLSSF